MGILLGYSMFMTFILLLPRDVARKAFKIFHPSYGNELPEKSYADDCRVYTPENPFSNYFNIYNTIFDVHFVAHFGGWWFKMMIIRDVKIAWIISLSFELVEISFRHWLTNFWECWWDVVSFLEFTKSNPSFTLALPRRLRMQHGWNFPGSYDHKILRCLQNQLDLQKTKAISRFSTKKNL